MSGFNEISPTNLMRLIGTGDCPAIIDVRIDEDVADIPLRIPTAIAADHRDLSTILPRLGGRPCVVVCHKGKKLSSGSAAWLRAQGVSAEVLSGGMVAWQVALLPAVPAAVLQDLPALWVTRHRPKIDRVACPWLIRRFVDPDADFLFVPPSDVHDVAEKFGATAFDMPDGRWGHDGPLCSFDVMVREFGLGHPALDRLARIVRAADTDQHDLAPQAAGLLAVSAGLSKVFKDDNAQMEAGFLLYDALYRWARDAATETHGPHPTGDQ
ncbi:chromate resistance protein ChrB domain-containing protein [Cognatishimia maritima]|nr:chromate resistance protein ChrB domain-containing protein [Cognatishimia maritima]